MQAKADRIGRTAWTPWLSLAAALSTYALASLALVVTLAFALAVMGDADDILRGWRNPSHYESVRQWTTPHDLRTVQAASRGDFDGDGVDDLLEIHYLHREFITAESTSGMVYVRSGADGTVLLAHPTPTPMMSPLWCADSDGDGADEVFVPFPTATMFAFERP